MIIASLPSRFHRTAKHWRPAVTIARRWDFATRREQTNLKAHESDVWSVAFSPDGRTLISGDGDWKKPGQVKLWDPATLQLRQTLAASEEVLSVACSPDGRTIAAGCADGTVKAWVVEKRARE